MPSFPKPQSRAAEKKGHDREAAKVARSVRQQCVLRDGDCRIGDWENNPDDWHSDELNDGGCGGRSEWAHLGEYKRFKTRGQSPEARHTTSGSLMLCAQHHRAYDQGRMTIMGDDANKTLHFEARPPRIGMRL